MNDGTPVRDSKQRSRPLQLLMRLLPAEFRGDYGPEMEQVFAEQREEARRSGDKMGILRLWWDTAKGIFTTAPSEHWSMLKQDTGFAMRMMRKNLGFTIAAIIVLGLGIGANTAIFSVVNAVLLKPLPFAHGERLLMLSQRTVPGGGGVGRSSVPELIDYRAQSRSMDGIVEYHNMQFILLGRAEPERVETGVVSWNFFDVFGVKPLVGRMFEPADEKPGAPAVLLLSYEYWLRSFGGDPTVVGKTFRMNDKPHVVIGVLPPFPQYPHANDVYMTSAACPFRSSPEMIANRKGRMLRLFGTMKPGVTPGQAQADLSTVAATMQRDFPTAYSKDDTPKMEVNPLKAELTRDAKPTMLFLLAAAGFVLLIACANVANLNLARMVRRGREMGLRAAMGASRVRLFRQLLTESFILAFGGGLLGLLLATSGLKILTTFIARFTPRANEIHIDAQVLFFTLGIAALVSILTGTAPALARRGNLAAALKEGGTQSTTGARRSRTRGALIVAQVAVSFLLLIGAGLMVRSLINLQRVDAGFRPENVLTVQMSLDFSKYMSDPSMLNFSDSLLEKVRAMPQVTSAAMSGEFPLDKSPAFNNEFLIEGRQANPNDKPTAEFNAVTPDYFRTLGIPILSGREFDGRDRPDKLRVAIVNQSVVNHYFHGQDPVGRRVSFDEGKNWTEIVGVAGDVRERELSQTPKDYVCVPYAQYPQMAPGLVALTQGDPMNIARTVVTHLYEVDPNQPAGKIQSLEQVRSESIAAPRLTANLLGLFALLALAIAAAGIGGVMALSVSQRIHEIGVRMAIGARPVEIVAMILRQGMGLALVGVLLGLAAAFALTQSVRTFLFGVTPTDPLTFVGVAAVLTVAACAACYIPARRAARIDPLRALRVE
ncbi:MAG TPA: ABC transporter permease [Candidatus Eremiobacteraceae bacterium]|nr:ABC transporter permease [Candidatus Eremiobacteraceae bacterium]